MGVVGSGRMLLLEVTDSFWGSERLDSGKFSGYVKPQFKIMLPAG